jgi:CubicO group peptidase (beta-lactamase class C family)
MGLGGMSPPAGLPPGHFEDKAVPNWTFQAYAGAGALRSTARDMARFLEACLAQGGGPLGASFASTTRPQHANLDSGGYIGLGWSITDAGSVWHGGVTGGSTAFLGYSPRTRTGLVILSNDDVLSQRLGLRLLGDELPRRKVEVITDASKYVGQYPLSSQYTIEVTQKDGILQGRVIGQPAFALRQIGVDRFAIVGAPSEISFERTSDGEVTALTLHENGRDQRGSRSDLSNSR